MTTEFSVKRITDALAAVDKARQEVDSAKATYKARRELLAEAQAALEDAIRAETSPVPLFDQPPTSEVSFTAEVGKALREGLAGTGVVLHENVSVSLGEGEPDQAYDYEPPEPAEEVFPEPVAWNVYDAYRRKDTGQVEARSYSEAERIARGHYPEIPEGARLVTRVKPKQWDGAAAAPDAWRNQGVGLALRTLTVPTTKKLGQAGLATVGQLKDWFLANPGKSIDGLGSKGTLAVEEALTKYLESRPVPSRDVYPDGDEDAE